MKSWCVCVVWAMLLLTTACAVTPAPQPTHTQPSRFLSLSPESLGRSLALSQLVTGEYGDRVYKMRFEIDITPARLAVAGISPLGVTLFTLEQHQGKRPVVTRLIKSAPFDPRHILFDLYLTYWPPEILKTALLPLSMKFEQVHDQPIRRVRGSDGQLVAEITYPANNKNKSAVMIQHFDFPYRLQIETLKTDGQP